MIKIPKWNIWHQHLAFLQRPQNEYLISKRGIICEVQKNKIKIKIIEEEEEEGTTLLTWLRNSNVKCEKVNALN